MRDIQLYIKPQGQSDYLKVDLFNDESISLTQTIKNAKDVSKIFTDFSKSFTVPASKNNNRIFKHYDQFVIQNGFDARNRVDARIEINSVPFKTGRVKLEGVDTKNGVAYAYRLTFYGNTINLKDGLGEEKLSSLDLSQYNQLYTSDAIIAGLQANANTEDIIVPLITHSQRLSYGDGGDLNSGDLSTAAGSHGVWWRELKYAIRVDAIVRAIEDKLEDIGFKFSEDSFFSPSYPNYYDLFMWLHRKKGDITSEIKQEPLSKLIQGYSGTSYYWAFISGSKIVLTQSRYVTRFRLALERTVTDPYTITINRDGIPVYSASNVTAQVSSIDLLPAIEEGSYDVYISSSTFFSFNSIVWTIEFQEPFNSPQTATFNVPNSSDRAVGNVEEFNISQQIPEMTIIEFLSGLFKMFNLVAEIDENNIITVKPLDDYYELGATRDITEYVDNNSGGVDVAIPYSEIEFRYKGTKTILADQYGQLTNKAWGADKYNSQDNLKEGGKFVLELPFEHMQFERIIAGEFAGSQSNLPTPIMYGYFVDDNQSSYIGAPLLFYPIYNPIPSYNIKVVKTKLNNGDFSETETINGPINVPSNSRSLDGGAGDSVVDNIHFYLERNEYDLDAPGFKYYKTLFYNYYWNYIASLFDPRKRLSKIKANLPISFLANYSLSDILILQGLKYRINSITTDLTSGQSDLELLNIVNVPKPNYLGGGDVSLFAVISGQTVASENSSYLYTATVSGSATGLTSYEWSVSELGTILSGQGTAAVNILWGSVEADTVQTVTLTVRRNNDGTPVQFTTQPYSVDVIDSADPQPLSVVISDGSIPPASQVAEGTLRFYDALVSGDYQAPVTYTWSVDGGVIESTPSDGRIGVRWNTVTANYNGSIGVTVNSNDLQEAIVSYPVEVVDGAAPYINIQITNIVTPVSEGFTTTYGSIIDSNIVEVNPDIYSWSITGGTINSGQFSDTVNVTWNTPGNGTIRVDVVRDPGYSAFDENTIVVGELVTLAEITGVDPFVLEGDVVSYGSIIGGNTTGPITYTWSVSKGEISGGTYDGSGNSTITGVGIDSIQVTWGLYEVGTGTIGLLATRQDKIGIAQETTEVLPIFYLFEACDGGETIIDRQGEVPQLNQRFADYSVLPIEYYTYNGSTVNSSAGFTIVDVQPVFESGAITFGCPPPPEPPQEDINITGPFVIPGSGQSGVVYTIETLFGDTDWVVDDQPLPGFTGIDITFTTSTSGTGDGSVTVNFGPNPSSVETRRSQIVVTQLGVNGDVATITITQDPS